MGLFTKKCDICFHEKSGVRKNRRGWKVCSDCRTNALKKMSDNEFMSANIQEISYASKENGSLTASISYCESKKFNAKDTLDNLKPEVGDVEISLKSGEVCYYQGGARGYNEKNMVTGYQSTGGGVSVRVLKGVSIRTGESTSVPIRNLVSETSEGELIITNMRVVLLSPKYGFNIERHKIESIDPFRNGFRLYSNGKCYTVITYDNPTIIYILQTMNKYLDENPEENLQKKSKSSLSVADEIKKYKELLDMNAITEEEFEKKKKELLNL